MMKKFEQRPTDRVVLGQELDFVNSSLNSYVL